MKYPIYIPSKGRHDRCSTALLLKNTGIKHFIVVEPQDYDLYSLTFDKENLLVLPFSNLGQGLQSARNWIKDYSQSKGEEKHWQLDDDFRSFSIYDGRKDNRKNIDQVLGMVEEFTDRYENVVLSGPSSKAFSKLKKTPYSLNQMIYCCMLVDNRLQNRWRTKDAEDIDMSIQVLKQGFCTILFNIFNFDMAPTGRNEGGCKTDIYDDEGNKCIDTLLFDLHPELPIKTKSRWGRVRHDCSLVWRLFKQKPILKKK